MSARHAVPLDRFELIGLPAGSGDPDRLAEAGGDWLPAVVPGGVRESLLAAGRIEHPYYGANERKDAWIDDQEWWYRTTFAGPRVDGDDRARLVFDGLDTVADVWLNGTHLGHQENQFRPAELEVTALLRPTNTLLVRFSPPLAGREAPPEVAATVAAVTQAFAALAGEAAPDAAGGGDAASGDDAAGVGGPLSAVATTLRKAPFSWGWDFGPNVPSIGIWRPARLSVEHRAVLTGHHVAVGHLSADRSYAEVTVRVEAESFAAGPLAARVRLVSPAGRAIEAEIPLPSGGVGATRVGVADPELWWTHDLGDQPRYAVTIDLVEGDAVLDSVSDLVGLRTVVVDRSADPDEGGRYFRFVLNGTPVFARGANWLPLSTLVGSVRPEEYRDRVGLARDGNMTMLRVWGGGIYEHDAFYAACDELGLLVWQDFVFACMDYPSGDPALRREVTLEAEYQVKRLRNHACLAQWSGNNEVQVIHAVAAGDLEPGNWGWHFFHQILPAAVATYDGFTHYWPGSPYGEGGLEAVFGTQDGDRHTWEVWHGDMMPSDRTFPTKGDERHYRRYLEDRAKFVSEFGIHAAPELDTLRRWIPEADLVVHSATFDLHNKDNPKNKGDELLAVTTGLPTGIEEYVEFTQAVQAEGMALAIEHYRRRQPHTAGALMWQFNDVWPGFSWSVVDVDGVPKSAYFAARRACAPVAVSFADRADGGLELWLVNNGPTAVTDLPIDVELGRFGGADRVGTRVLGSAPVGGAVLVWSAAPGDVPRDERHYAWASGEPGSFPAARHYFAEIGRLELGRGSLEVVAGDGTLTIRSTGHGYSVRIAQPVPGIRLSDNCFDLRDGDEATVTVRGADPAVLAVAAFGRSLAPA